jgi:hypothetical protein
LGQYIYVEVRQAIAIKINARHEHIFETTQLLHVVITQYCPCFEEQYSLCQNTLPKKQKAGKNGISSCWNFTVSILNGRPY